MVIDQGCSLIIYYDQHTAISINNQSRSAIVTAALVPIAVLIVVIILGFSLFIYHYKVKMLWCPL